MIVSVVCTEKVKKHRRFQKICVAKENEGQCSQAGQRVGACAVQPQADPRDCETSGRARRFAPPSTADDGWDHRTTSSNSPPLSPPSLPGGPNRGAHQQSGPLNTTRTLSGGPGAPDRRVGHANSSPHRVPHQGRTSPSFLHIEAEKRKRKKGKKGQKVKKKKKCEGKAKTDSIERSSQTTQGDASTPRASPSSPSPPCPSSKRGEHSRTRPQPSQPATAE